jgi:hypothetical protein
MSRISRGRQLLAGLLRVQDRDEADRLAAGRREFSAKS